METLPRTVHGSELKVGDRVRLDSLSEWNTAIVRNVEEHGIRLFRPYGSTSGFTYSGGTICYVGIEDFLCSRNAPFTLLSREEMK